MIIVTRCPTLITQHLGDGIRTGAEKEKGRKLSTPNPPYTWILLRSTQIDTFL